MRALIGRAQELARVVAQIEAGSRIVSVLGAPGIGKTRLAENAAQVLAPQFEGGQKVWWVDLSNAFTRADLSFCVGSTIHDPRLLEPHNDLKELLADQGRALLVLDNFEQLSFAADLLETWAKQAPELQILITSRERLAVAGECVVELAPLPCPAPEASQEQIVLSDAVILFQLRAEEAGARPSSDVSAVAEIVRRLDGIPLAIELAAARTRLLSPAELASRLGRGEDALGAATQRSSHERHRTLNHAIAWSWNLLAPEEQLGLAIFSMFPKSFSLATAEALLVTERASRVAGGEREPATDPIELLAALREKSLLHTTETGRAALYASIRSFAQLRFSELPEAQRRRLSWSFATSFAAIAGRFSRSRLFQEEAPEPTLHKAVRAEADNLVLALSFAKEAERSAERATAITDLATAVALSHAAPVDVVEQVLRQAQEDDELLDTTRLAALLITRQGILSAHGRTDDALRIVSAVAALDQVPPGLLALAKLNAGILLRGAGDTQGAMALHGEVAELLGDKHPRLLGINTACIGRLHCDLQNHEAARLWNQRATELCDGLGDRWLAGLGLANLAQLEQEAQNFERAEELLSSAVARFRETGEAQYEAIYAATCGGLYFEWGRLEHARHWFLAGQQAITATAPPLTRILLHGGRAALEAAAGDFATAEQQLEITRRQAARVQTPFARLLLEMQTATVALARGATEGAAAAKERLSILSDVSTSEGKLVASNLDLRFALRMLHRTQRPRAEQPEAALRYERDALWFCLAGAKPVMLGRRGSLRRVLAALLQAYREQPGVPLGGESLAELGWPGERMKPESASARLRVTISTLRKLGLRSLLLTRDDGYLLDPGARLEASGELTGSS